MEFLKSLVQVLYLRGLFFSKKLLIKNKGGSTMKKILVVIILLISANIIFADKYVGILYETWFNAVNSDGARYAPIYPAPVPYPAWRYWGEPALGRYLSTDQNVINKHADMIAAAGIDFIIVDYSNNNINVASLHYPLGPLLRIYQSRVQNGIKTPKISFLIGNAGEMGNAAIQEQQMNKVWNEVYTKYDKRIFFNYQGKPLLMPVTQHYFNVSNNFTWKPAWGLMGNNHSGRVSFCEHYPQPAVDGFIAVSPAQQSTYMSNTQTAHGRRWNYRSGRNDGNESQNYDDQWNRAIELNAGVVLLSTWNEWTAQFINNNFTDQFNTEFSKDIEPMKGGFGDFYYNKTKQWITKYKGGSTGIGGTSISTVNVFDSRVFNVQFYYNKYSDLQKAFGWNETSLKNHWKEYGLKEGRIGHPNFSVVDYVNRYQDLKNAFGANYLSALEHYLVNGIREGRNGAPGGTTNTSDTNTGIPIGKWVTIVAKHSGKAMHVENWSKSNGAGMVQWDNNKTENSQWVIEKLSNGNYKIRNKFSGKIIETGAYSNNDGGKVQQWDYIDHKYQQWKIEKLEDGWYKITNAGSGKVLDVSGRSKENMSSIYQWGWLNGDNQKWRFDE